MKYTLLILILALALPAWSQEPDGMRKIEAARIALITERLELTPEQAEKFWPLYREYSGQREVIRKEFMEARREVKAEGMSEEESRKLLAKGLELKERQLLLEKAYAEKFNTVITSRQILLLRKAEDDFRQMLLERLEHRREQRDRMQRREDLKNNN